MNFIDMLTLDNALLFRIVHVKNIPWILQNGGLCCQNAPTQDPNYVNIGNLDLISKRAQRQVPIPPGGILSDYVPFYFTPFSIMLYNIKTGHGGIRKCENQDIVFLVSSLHRLSELSLPFIFTSGHAYLQETEYFSDLSNLDCIDWEILRNRDFRRDPEDPGKLGRYQAEGLVYQHFPLEALLWVCCYDDSVQKNLMLKIEQLGLKLKVKLKPLWYF